MTTKELLEKELSTEMSAVALTKFYSQVNTLRKKADGICKQLKQKEDIVKTTISNKLMKERILKFATEDGTFSNYTFETVKVADKDTVIQWVKDNFDDVKYMFTALPLSKPKLIDYAGESKELPPGMDWYKEIKLSITAKK
jgi:hypothetical protein